ncbi:MAG TPA: Rpn family recombination-promoting nuclease/putative transposase [Candidatus Ozemobacteraceae bacterium]|nr:Rpn family recombination-promoting nuclease/putative transposase [Candidatus Ozemobacteraceae bacterium]
MGDHKRYPLRNDFVFKLVFGKEGNEEILAKLIDALLHFTGDRCIADLTLLSPLNLKEFHDDKFTIVDVKATDLAGRRFTIEMQVRELPSFAKRMAYYLALLYTGQLLEGESFEKLNPSYGIAILDYVMFDGFDQFQSAFQFQEQATGLVLPDLMELHFIELPKFKTKPRGLQTRLEKWLHMIRFAEMYENAKSLPDELRTDEIFVRVLEELEHVNADERMRAILEQRDKEERTRITELNAAEKRGLEKGREKGREEGREEERLDVARKMLAEGFDISLIAKMTDMSIAEIEKIKAALP